MPVPLQIALLVFVLAWGLALWRGPLTINIGAEDSVDMLYLTPGDDGFFQAETRAANPDFPQADTTYRWAGRTSSDGSTTRPGRLADRRDPESARQTGMD